MVLNMRNLYLICSKNTKTLENLFTSQLLFYILNISYNSNLTLIFHIYMYPIFKSQIEIIISHVFRNEKSISNIFQKLVYSIIIIRF